MLPIISGLISGGLSALSGFGAQKAAKKQAKAQAAADMLAQRYNETAIYNKNAANAIIAQNLAKVKEKTVESRKTSTINKSYVDVDAMMAAGEKAGFNPVTWLSSGALQAYTQTKQTMWDKLSTTRSGHNAVAVAQLQSPEVPQMQASQQPLIPNSMQILGDAASAGFNAYNKEANRQESQEFQKELLNMQLGAIQLANRNNSRTGRQLVNQGTPAFSTSGDYITGGGAAGRTGGLSSRGGGSPGGTGVNNPNVKFEEKTPEIMNPFAKYGMKVDTSLPNAENIEDTYGEPLSWLYGVGKLGADAIRTTTGRELHTIVKDGVEYFRRDSLSTSQNGKSPARRTWEYINRPSPVAPAPKPGWAVPKSSMGSFYD